MNHLLALIMLEIGFLWFAARKNTSYLIFFILFNLLFSARQASLVLTIWQISFSIEAIFGASIFVAHALLNKKSRNNPQTTVEMFSSYAQKILYYFVLAFTFLICLSGLKDINFPVTDIKKNLGIYTSVYISFYLCHLIYITLKEVGYKYATCGSIILTSIASTLIIAFCTFGFDEILYLFVTGTVVKTLVIVFMLFSVNILNKSNSKL